MREDARDVMGLQREAKLVSGKQPPRNLIANDEQSMNACVCTPRRTHYSKPEGSELAKMRFYTATRE